MWIKWAALPQAAPGFYTFDEPDAIFAAIIFPKRKSVPHVYVMVNNLVEAAWAGKPSTHTGDKQSYKSAGLKWDESGTHEVSDWIGKSFT